jgi:hypothetical protein
MTQQPTNDGSIQGGQLLETTVVGKKKGKGNVNKEEEGLLQGFERWQGRRNVTVNSKYDNQQGYNEWTMSPQIWGKLDRCNSIRGHHHSHSSSDPDFPKMGPTWPRYQT